MAKLTDVQIREIRRRFEIGDIYQWELAIEYGVTTSNIGVILSRNTWKL